MSHPIRDNPSLKRLIHQYELKFVDITPPIEEEIVDTGDLLRTFQNLPLIPYSGNDAVSSHRLVNVLYSMRKMSTTYSGVLNDFKTYALKGDVQVVQNNNSFFGTGIEDREISSSEKVAFDLLVRENFKFEDVNPKKLALLLNDSWHSVGHMGVEVITQTLFDKTIVSVKFHHPTNFCFTRNEKIGIGNEVAISRRWDQDYMRRFPPRLLPVYPFEYQYKDGSTRTFFFEKNGGEVNGRPEDLAALPAKYNEYKLEQYLTKKNKKLWLPDYYIETEDPDTMGAFTDDESAREAGYIDAVDRIERQFTNAGEDTRAAIITNRPYGARPSFIYKFEGLVGADQVQIFQDMFEDRIVTANGWSVMLLKMNAKTGFSTNEFLDVFGIKSVTKIMEIQTTLSTFINSILTYGFTKLGITTDLGIKFSSPLQDLLDEYKNKKNVVNPIDTEGSDQPDSREEGTDGGDGTNL